MSTFDMLEDLGHEALEVLRRDGPSDLMITDFSVPRMNGVERGLAG